MQVSDEEALSAPSSPASKSQSRARGSLPPLAGHQPLGPDDDPFAMEGRGTPHDTTPQRASTRTHSSGQTTLIFTTKQL